MLKSFVQGVVAKRNECIFQNDEDKNDSDSRVCILSFPSHPRLRMSYGKKLIGDATIPRRGTEEAAVYELSTSKECIFRRKSSDHEDRFIHCSTWRMMKYIGIGAGVSDADYRCEVGVVFLIPIIFLKTRVCNGVPQIMLKQITKTCNKTNCRSWNYATFKQVVWQQCNGIDNADDEKERFNQWKCRTNRPESPNDSICEYSSMQTSEWTKIKGIHYRHKMHKLTKKESVLPTIMTSSMLLKKQ